MEFGLQVLFSPGVFGLDPGLVKEGGWCGRTEEYKMNTLDLQWTP